MVAEFVPMENSREEPSLVNTCAPGQSQSEIVPSPALASNKEDTKLDVEMHNSSESNLNTYPSSATKVFVGIGLALAVFLVC